jgi:pimeloyl-ACP methyl ester carboxylesterase
VSGHSTRVGARQASPLRHRVASLSGHSTVRSKDGTSIAYDSAGDGPALILVGGAFSYRGWKGWRELTELLAPRFAVIGYDRRGRGDSGDAPEYAVEREIEDLDALVQAAGGSAHVFGMSSGGVLALRAAAVGVPMERTVVYQPPFSVDATGHLPPPDFEPRLRELVRSGRRGAAASYFMRRGMGVPRAFVALLRLARPLWRNLEAVAHTLPYDYAVMGETVHGKPLGPEPWASVTTPTLVVDGGKSPASLHKAADALAAYMPYAEQRTVAGQSHNVSMEVLAPVLEEFLLDRR